MATGVENVTCCQPDPVSDVNVAWASTAPVFEYSSPICVPLSMVEVFQNRTPFTWPATSERNLTPSVTAPSFLNGSVGAPACQIETVPGEQVVDPVDGTNAT